jgi:DNA-binding IclR family transcriptional regulator
MPGNPSGTNSRVVEVMNFLATHPTESFTLSEIAANVGLSLGSAHRLLTTLAEARYLSRHPKHKTYSLGMALVALGQAALAQHRDIDVTRREMIRLADELKVRCLATTVVRQELLVLACEGTPQTFEPPNQVGERRPFIPPLGMGHVAWADDAARLDYLSRTPAALSDVAHERLARSLELMRERGYGIAGSGPVLRALRQFTSIPIGYQGEDAYWAGLHQLLSDLSEREIQMLDIREAGAEGVSYITAPVFAPSGEVTLELSLSGLPSSLAVPDIAHMIDRLRAATAIITNEIRGRLPNLVMEPRLAKLRNRAGGKQDEGS